MSAGPYVETIPWCTWRNYSKYYDVPDVIMPNKPVTEMDFLTTKEQVKDFKPDVLIQVDAGYSLYRENNVVPGYKTAVLATDPHAIGYLQQFINNDYGFIMQKNWWDKKYNGFGLQWIPYAFDPQIHYWSFGSRRCQDVTIISGLMYPKRKEGLEAMQAAGIRVRHEVGLLYEEGTQVYNEGLIAYNWSSNDDLPMRVWEGMAYRNVVLTNRVSDLKEFAEFQEDVHYMAFDTVEECVEKALWLKANEDEAQKIARNGYAQVWIGRHTYAQRCLRMLRAMGVQM